MKTKFRLYKRADNGQELAPTSAGYKERHYYFRFTHKGKCYVRCLETPDATKAQARARAKYLEITTAVTTGEYKRLEATKLRQAQTGTIAQLLAAYRLAPTEASRDTREHNINQLLVFIGTDTARSIREINAAAARRHFEAVTAKILAPVPGSTRASRVAVDASSTAPSRATALGQEDAASLKRSANSRWAQAKSLFTPRCLEHYRSKDLYDDCLLEFLRAGELAKYRRIPKVTYNPPSEAIITATLAAWHALGETGTNRDLYLAIGHELAFGLRAGELAQATWSWHQIRAGYPVLDAPAEVKNKTGLIQVRALDPWYSQMNLQIDRHGWRGQPQDPIIPGTLTYRTDGLFRAVSDWLRQLGWATKKTNHALRAYAGCQVAMKYGIYEAQMFLRHSTVKVTEQNYSHFVQKFKPADAETIAARWAVATPVGPVPSPDAAIKVSSAVPDDTLDATKDFQQTPPDSATVKRFEVPTIDFDRLKN